MNRFKKAASFIIIIEIVIIILLNIIYIASIRTSGKFYRVEAERIVRLLEDDTTLQESPEKIDRLITAKKQRKT